MIDRGVVEYRGIGPEKGICVPAGEAFTYALDRCLHGNDTEVSEFRDMLVEWYYSGNWIEPDLFQTAAQERKIYGVWKM